MLPREASAACGPIKKGRNSVSASGLPFIRTTAELLPRSSKLPISASTVAKKTHANAAFPCRYRNKARLAQFVPQSRLLLLHGHVGSRGECKPRLGGKLNILFARGCRSRCARSSTRGCANGCAFAATG